MALRQVNVKRMLAFSGISHAGFMLMTILSISNAAGTLLPILLHMLCRNSCF
jgi:NADH-quinone oxidoreductase subunit N